MTRRAVLWVVLHDLGRSGVPVALERMLRWQRASAPEAVEVHVIAGRDGPLHPEMRRSAASVTAFEPATGRSLTATTVLAASQLAGRPTGTAAQGHLHRLALRRLPRPDVVLVQGAGAWPLFETIEPAVGDARLVVHLHELDIALGRSGLGDDLGRVMAQPDRILAVCEPVAAVARAHGADESQLRIVPGSADDPPGGWDRPVPTTGASTIVSIGQEGWRKGTDRAVAGAFELARRRPGTAWHWIGDPAPSEWSFAVGSDDPLIHHAAEDDPWTVVAEPAALVVTSREDPLPLVVLEAGARGVPVVATGTGGLVDLLASDRGLLVDGSDLDALVDAVSDCLDDPAAACARAVELRRQVQREHATAVVGPRWLDAVLGRG